MFDLTPKGFQTDNVSLMVGGKVYGGWLSFSVVRSIEAPSGSFALAISDKWPGSRAPWAIEPGDDCQLNLGGETLITGYVDDSMYRLTANSRDLSVTGRDKTADLVDCSYIDKPDQWREAGLSDIAAALAAPFGVSVQFNGDSTPVKNFKVEPGETAFEAISRLCKLKGLLAWPDGRGGLIIGPAAAESLGVTIHEKDCISLSVIDSFTERYSKYVVKGQRPTLEAGTDAGAAKQAFQTKDEATDPAVKRYRPLLIVSEGAGAEAAERALWEASARAGRGLTVEATVPGYRVGGGALWALNKLCGISAPGICLSDELLISQVKYDLNQQGGHTTTLTMCRPDAFKPEPVKPPKGGGGAGAGLPPGTVIY